MNEMNEDDAQMRVKEHLKLMPSRYVKDFCTPRDIALHMEALDVSRRNKGAFAVRSGVQRKTRGSTGEDEEEEEEKILEDDHHRRRSEGEEATTTTRAENEGAHSESNGKRRSRKKQSPTTDATKSRTNLTLCGTHGKGTNSPDSILLPDFSNANADGFKNSTESSTSSASLSRFYHERGQQNHQQQQQIDHGRGMNGGNMTFCGASTSSSVYSEEGCEDYFSAAQAIAEEQQPFYSLAVACKNRPRVLSEISTAVNDCGLDVHEAHIYNLKDGYVLDVFTVHGWKNDDEEGLSQALVKFLTAGIVPERRGLGGSPFPTKTDVNKVCMELDSCEIYDIDPESDRQGWGDSDDEGEDPLKVSNQMSDSEQDTKDNNYHTNNNDDDDDDNVDGKRREIEDLNRNQISALDSTKLLERDVIEAMEKSRKDNKEPGIDSRKLRLIREIGSGSFGVLYKGEYRGKKVAAKFPSGTHNDNQNQLRAMHEFFKELSVLSKVKHENIIRIVGAMTKMPRLCIVTEYVDNGPLNNYLVNQGSSLKLVAQVEIACGIARGMAYLHSKNFIHRDLKASNVLLQSTMTPSIGNGDGKAILMDARGPLRPIICDFGLSREVAKDGVMTPETGTYRWMAPEVIAHSRYSTSADVYSFAIVLWEIVCEGHVPYPEHAPLQAAVAVVQKGIRPILPYNSHPIMTNAMERCWISEPENRPRFTDLVMDFESHMLGSTTKLNLLPSKSFFSRLKSMSRSKKRDRM